MRIHSLEVTAFGPFSGTESIDFDSLTDAGMFLLCGPTGAGKTSVLDAVCFGLYGEVPGERNSAKRLRSDHAAAGVAPSVLLELSISGRRFRIRRSPVWHRPKRRGTGTTTAPARVVLEERVGGSWVHLSNRLDETGHLVTDLLGMNVTQFTQVAMLPQGRFQSFLRAKSDERHKVLQKLFRTSRFEDIEKWLVSRRQCLRTASEAHQDAVASVVSRLSEAAEADLPSDWDLNELALVAEEGQVADWAAALVTSAVSTQERSAVELQRVTVNVATSRLALQRARSNVELRDRHQEALGIERSLSEGGPKAAEARARIDAARRAAPVAPLVRIADDAERDASAALKSLGEVLAEAARLLGTDGPGLTSDDLEAAERDAHEAASIAKVLLPREVELKQAQHRFERATALLADVATEAVDVDDRCAEIPVTLAGLRRLLSEHEATVATRDWAELSELRLVAQLSAANQGAAIGIELVSARAQLRLRVDVAQTLREEMHNLREARINGMAAELAAALAIGDSCPVCGSAEHPAVARPVVGAPTESDEERARTAFEDADFVRQAQAEAVTTLERNKAVAEQASGGKGIAALEVEIREVRERLTLCRAASAAQGPLAGDISSLETELRELLERATDLGVTNARLSEELDHTRASIDKLTAELSALFDNGDIASSVERLIEARTLAGAAFGNAREALTARDAAVARSEETRQHALDCAQDHGFATLAAASGATLSSEEILALEGILRARDELRTRADTILCDATVQAAVLAPPPDLPAAELATREAEAELADCGAWARLSQARAARLVRLEVELTAELDAWAPTRASHAVAQAVSTLADGKGGDNALQMRLSGYVLSTRLKQVVAAANERLRTMSDQRYTLEHSAARGVGEVRGGLSLQVRDEWTGESRDPATLSGGETFVASLALALGLADVVTQEAGGSNIDTLFIDEGFGTLDPETLDDVMNTLDGLRNGGRVLGIVSHVPEMRTRVTAQLQIRKDRSGSHVVAAREAV